MTKWLLVVMVIGSSGSGLEKIETIGPFEREALCKIASQVMRDNIATHAMRDAVPRCLQVSGDPEEEE